MARNDEETEQNELKEALKMLNQETPGGWFETQSGGYYLPISEDDANAPVLYAFQQTRAQVGEALAAMRNLLLMKDDEISSLKRQLRRLEQRVDEVE